MGVLAVTSWLARGKNRTMTNLKQARQEGKIDQFIAEREGEKADPEAFNRAVQAMARKSPTTRKASSRSNGGD